MSQPRDGFTRYEIRRHTVITEPNRIVHLILRGLLDADESKEMQTIVFDHSDRYGQLALLADISKANGMTPASRHAWVHVPRPLPIEISCLYGGSFAIRTLAQTVYRAARLLRPSAFDYPLEMPVNEADGRLRIAVFRKTSSTK